MSNTITTIITILAPVVSAVLVAVLNNWDKINPGKAKIKEIYEVTNATQADVTMLKSQINKLSSAQRTDLQTQILEKCKRIQQAIGDEDIPYDEELKHLIILYREYYLCGFNSQGKLYFNDTISKAAEDNNVLVHDLMNRYFSEYDPEG